MGAGCLCLLLLLACGAALGQGQKELRTAEEIRRLTEQQAEARIPVRLRGVVTFFDENLFSRFVQDETAGIYLGTNTPPLKPGQLVEVEGTTAAGEYAPILETERVKVVGEAPLPAAKPATFEDLASGSDDSQYVEIAGIVRAVRLDKASLYYAITLASGGGRLTVYVRQLPGPDTGDVSRLVDSIVRVRGVCSTQFNRQRQLFAIRLMVPRPEDLVIEKLSMAYPFDIPRHSIASLLQFTPRGTYGRRVKVAGQVVYQRPGKLLYIQNDQYGLRVETTQETPLKVGDQVEVLGFTAQGKYTPTLEDAVYRKVARGMPLPPDDVAEDEVRRGNYDCRLVRLTATLLDVARQSSEQFLVLESDHFIFHATLEYQEGSQAFPSVEKGSKVSVTGICLIEPGDWMAGEGWRANSFQLLVRSPEDLVVLKAAPWWTLRRLLWTVGVLGVVVLAAFAWVGVLRRRVQKQTEIIRQQLQVEATLKERYQELFENANDMVFTNDLHGRITSINQAGESLLQRPRAGILSQNLMDLVAEDQRAAARQWLDQVISGADVPTAEWDFINASGYRVKVEIGSRLVEQRGGGVEVESSARDVTERRRLERELLEVSNREQRRIGHDLHDGICQQLVAIAYLLDVLGDRLKERNAPEFVEAERIGTLINEANAQARNVARGLFPVRLEEHGLVLALEELAASIASRYRIECRFVCKKAPPQVDGEVELHLYYIVQEALLNAVNHGKAATLEVTLAADGDRFKLSVRDNGSGFDLSGKNRSGMGIRIMRYRAKVIGATLDVQSRVNEGTEIACVFNPSPRESTLKGKND
jgi:PAS domain S-box-containing protein